MADEVKLLAGQTATATEDVRAKVTAIQDDTQSAIDASTGSPAPSPRMAGHVDEIARLVDDQINGTHAIASLDRPGRRRSERDDRSDLVDAVCCGGAVEHLR